MLQSMWVMGLDQAEHYCTHAQLFVLHSWRQPGLSRGSEIFGIQKNERQSHL